MDAREHRFRDTLARLEREVQAFACPIYGVRGDIGQPIGSGFLLSVAGEVLLLTAAHVLHERHACTLQMPGQTRIVPFGGSAYSTGPTQPDPSPNYEHDIAFMVLDTAAMLESPSSPVLRVTDLDTIDLPARDTAYGFVGYPASENRARPGYMFERRTFYYGGQAASRSKYEILGYDPRTHFIMNFERDQMVDHAGNIVQVPEPLGMSGGPVFKLGTFQEIDAGTAQPRVIALTTEWGFGSNVLIGVRIALLTEAIRQILPAAASALPPAEHFYSDVTVNTI